MNLVETHGIIFLLNSSLEYQNFNKIFNFVSDMSLNSNSNDYKWIDVQFNFTVENIEIFKADKR